MAWHYWSLDSKMPFVQETALPWRTAHPEQPTHPHLSRLYTCSLGLWGVCFLCPISTILYSTMFMLNMKPVSTVPHQHNTVQDIQTEQILETAPIYHSVSSARVNCGLIDTRIEGLSSWTLQLMEQLPGDPRPALLTVSMSFLPLPCLSKCGPHISSTVYPRKLARNSRPGPGPTKSDTDTLQLWKPHHKDYH